MDTAKFEREVLHLPAADRARLAQRLLLSLEDLPQAELVARKARSLLK